MSNELLGLVVAAIVGIFCITFGIQLLRNKWLRLIAGNTFGDIPKKKVNKVRKPLAIVFILVGCGCVALGIAGYLGYLGPTH
ncbi:hypothetical protein JCM14202_650 [Agrilactobacillus composti DSM 18527 = JCM 14202]|uniref:hypothetical protein n=1 Tax=Agrilactobacillus composti TaxID=398555 RepID=UPI00042DF239|nr:hypothetical protein [Agrilactobacillus composti]GAF38820.1 hypothetical protein JCM14202_650 [Agrilactobacillus composti DSM 18527 = JCM 14202]